jgi:hypothetical protein
MWDDTRRLFDAIDPIGPIGVIHTFSFGNFDGFKKADVFCCVLISVVLSLLCCCCFLGRDLEELIRMTLKSAIECNDVDDRKNTIRTNELIACFS